MNRRQFVLASTVGITALAGCSGSENESSNRDNELRNDVSDTLEAARDDYEQAERELGNSQGFMNQEKWGSAAGSAGDAADAFSNAQNEFKSASNRAGDAGKNELESILQEYEDASSTGVQVCTSFEQGCESMIDGDTDSARSHFERADEYATKLQNYDLASASEIESALES